MSDFWELSRAILGSIFVLLAPGFAWSLVLFRKKEIVWIERVALSVGLSIALVSLTIFALNLLAGVEVNPKNSLIAIAILTAAPLVYHSATRAK